MTINPGTKTLRRGRHSTPGGIYFITATTDQRIPWFQVWSFACLLCQCLERKDYRADAKILCWVVMPDHFHMLVQTADEPLSRVMNRLKSRTAVALNRDIGRTGRFWAPGFYDHALRKVENVRAVARYIVANPIRAGLVTSAGEYPYWNAVWL